MLNDGADLLQKIVKSGHVDGAATVLVGPKAATGLLAGYVADGALLDKILHTVAKAVLDGAPGSRAVREARRGEERLDQLPQDLDSHSGRLPRIAQKAVKLIGEKLDIVIGVGKENAYLAVGRDAMATLEEGD